MAAFVSKRASLGWVAGVGLGTVDAVFGSRCVCCLGANGLCAGRLCGDAFIVAPIRV
jgi:hypothetical protein